MYIKMQQLNTKRKNIAWYKYVNHVENLWRASTLNSRGLLLGEQAKNSREKNTYIIIIESFRDQNVNRQKKIDIDTYIKVVWIYLPITAERNLRNVVSMSCRGIQAMWQDTPTSNSERGRSKNQRAKDRAYKRPCLSPHKEGGGEEPRTERQANHCWSV